MTGTRKWVSVLRDGPLTPEVQWTRVWWRMTILSLLAMLTATIFADSISVLVIASTFGLSTLSTSAWGCSSLWARGERNPLVFLRRFSITWTLPAIGLGALGLSILTRVGLSLMSLAMLAPIIPVLVVWALAQNPKGTA